MADDGAVKFAFGAIGVGSYVYYRSFISYKLARRIADIPRSKIGSAAIGSNVEVQGQVINMADDGVISPLSERKGAAFIWKLEEYVRRGKNSSWEHRKTFYSTPYLYIHDGEESTAAIDLSSCDFQENIFDRTVKFSDGDFNIPEKAKNILTKTSMLDTTKTSFFFGRRNFRIQEKVFEDNQPVFVLGAAVNCPNTERPMNRDDDVVFGSRENSLRKKIADTFRLKKSDRSVVSKYDTDGNLTLDKAEEAAMMKDIEKEILALHGKDAVNEYLKNAKILFTIDESASGPFKLDRVYLSTKSEDDLKWNLKLKGFAGLIGGPILIAVGVFVLITKFS